jgi:hypothetical protein
MEGDYVLAVATLEPRKNLARAVEGARLAGVELRVVGAHGWGGVEVRLSIRGRGSGHLPGPQAEFLETWIPLEGAVPPARVMLPKV